MLPQQILQNNQFIKAIEEKLFSADDLERLNARLRDHGAIAHQLLQPKYLQAMQEGLFSVKDLIGLEYGVVHALLADTGITALREKLFSVNDLKRLDSQAAWNLLQTAKNIMLQNPEKQLISFPPNNNEHVQPVNASASSDASIEYQIMAGAWREFFTLLFDTVYFVGAMTDLFVPSKKKTPIGFSLLGTINGAITALIVAYGSARLQHAIDTHNGNPIDFTRDSLPSIDNANLPPTQTLHEKFVAFLTDAGTLSPIHAMEIGVAWVGQVFDTIGFLIGIISTGKYALNKSTQFILNPLIFLVAIPACWAAVRPSSNAIKFSAESAKNVPHSITENPNKQADNWTLAFIVARLLQASVSNTVCLATLSYKMAGYEPNTIFDVSTQGIKNTLPLILYITLCTVLIQYCISTAHQKLYRPHGDDLESNTPKEKVEEKFHSLPLPEKTIIALLTLGRMMSTGIDFAVPLVHPMSDTLSPGAYLAATLSLAFLGILASISDARTSLSSYFGCKDNGVEWLNNSSQSINTTASRAYSTLSDFFRNHSSAKSELTRGLMHDDAKNQLPAPNPLHVIPGNKV